MKKLLLLPIMLILSVVVLAQDDARKKIEAAKIALITERLDLSPEQAEKFWPIYNQYFDEVRGFKREYDLAKKNFDAANATEEEYKKLLDLGHQLKERQLSLERQFSERLLTVISNRQMLNLRKAEDDFKRMLMDRMRERNVERRRLQNMRERQQQRNPGRNNN